MSERFTPFYEWMAQWKDLNLSEALVLSRIKMWGNAGCFESYKTLSEKLKLDRRTIIRAVYKLISMGLVKIEYKDRAKQKKILKFDHTILTNMPVFGSKNWCHEVTSCNQTSVMKPPASVTESPDLVSQSHQLPKKNSTYLHQQKALKEGSKNPIYIYTKHIQDIRNKTDLISDLMTTQQDKPISKGEFARRKNDQLRRLGVLK